MQRPISHQQNSPLKSETLVKTPSRVFPDNFQKEF